MNDMTINIINKSLTKLALNIEELNVELMALYALVKSDRDRDKALELVNRFEDIEAKLDVVRLDCSKYMSQLGNAEVVNKCIQYALELKKKPEDKKPEDKKPRHIKNKNNSVEKIKHIKNAKYVDNVEFMDVNSINIGSTVGMLPTDATLSLAGICDAKLVITEKKTVILKENSIICKSNKRDVNSIDSARIREQRIEMENDSKWLQLAECSEIGIHGMKYIVMQDITFSGIDAAKVFILGRNLRSSDTKNSVKVGEMSLEDYLKLGSNTY